MEGLRWPTPVFQVLRKKWQTDQAYKVILQYMSSRPAWSVWDAAISNNSNNNSDQTSKIVFLVFLGGQHPTFGTDYYTNDWYCLMSTPQTCHFLILWGISFGWTHVGPLVRLWSDGRSAVAWLDLWPPSHTCISVCHYWACLSTYSLSLKEASLGFIGALKGVLRSRLRNYPILFLLYSIVGNKSQTWHRC